MAASEDISFSVGVVGADQLVAEAEIAAQIGGPGLFGDEGVRTGFDDASVNVIGAENPAKPQARLEENVVDIRGGAAAFFEGEGGGQAGDSSADNSDASQMQSSAAKAGCSCDNLTARLKACPGTNQNRQPHLAFRCGIFLHEARQVLHIVDRSFGKDAVPEIEDVSRASSGAAEDVFGARL